MAPHAQAGHKGDCFPMSMRRVADQSLAARSPARHPPTFASWTAFGLRAEPICKDSGLETASSASKVGRDVFSSPAHLRHYGFIIAATFRTTSAREELARSRQSSRKHRSA